MDYRGIESKCGVGGLYTEDEDVQLTLQRTVSVTTGDNYLSHLSIENRINWRVVVTLFRLIKEELFRGRVRGPYGMTDRKDGEERPWRKKLGIVQRGRRRLGRLQQQRVV